jgi:hypothetical protein
MYYYADKTYASNKVSFNFLFPKWTYWGEKYKNGAKYKLGENILILNDKKIKIFNKNNEDITNIFKQEVDLLKNDLYNRIFLKNLLKKIVGYKI